MGPETASCSGNARAFAGIAYVLTGESPTEEINRLNLRKIYACDVAVIRHSRPVFGKDR
jgi:hypothetical protein